MRTIEATQPEFRNTVRNLYRRFRNDSPFMLIGSNARQALEAAKTVARFQYLAECGVVRLRVVFDEDVDTSWMDAKDKEDWNGEAYGTIGEYLCLKCGNWVHADSVWGHIGYKDPGSPFENCYVAGIMAETLRQYDEACQD